MPFYDEFDLSTVDVLLISQYVYAYPASHFCSKEESWRITAVGLRMRRELGSVQQQLVYQNQWNIICILPARLR
jgi:hypothetical protein